MAPNKKHEITVEFPYTRIKDGVAKLDGRIFSTVAQFAGKFVIAGGIPMVDGSTLELKWMTERQLKAEVQRVNKIATQQIKLAAKDWRVITTYPTDDPNVLAAATLTETLDGSMRLTPISRRMHEVSKRIFGDNPVSIAFFTEGAAAEVPAKPYVVMLPEGSAMAHIASDMELRNTGTQAFYAPVVAHYHTENFAVDAYVVQDLEAPGPAELIYANSFEAHRSGAARATLGHLLQLESALPATAAIRLSREGDCMDMLARMPWLDRAAYIPSRQAQRDMALEAPEGP